MGSENFIINVGCGCNPTQPYLPAVAEFFALLLENDYRWTKPVKDAFNALIAGIQPETSNKTLVLAIGDDAPALQNGQVAIPYDNGSEWVIPELIGKVITDLRIGPQSIEPVVGGYSFASSTGTLSTYFVVYDSNIYIEAEEASVQPTQIYLVFSPDSSNKLVFNSNTTTKLIFNA